AAWSSDDAFWTVAVDAPEGEFTFTCGFFLGCSGYYDYARGHAPDFAGAAAFAGRIVHPQFWPDDLDVAGKRVVVIGSGATAVTLVPAMAKTAAHVTMLQRSPSHIVNRPSENALAQRLQRYLPAHLAYGVTRWAVILESMLLYRLARKRPQLVGKRIAAMAAQQLGPGVDVATHFTPAYKPWDQRVCVVPDGDLFCAIREGRASVATDEIERFTPSGLQLKSGRELQADIVVTATGLRMHILGGIAVGVDGVPFKASEAMSYKGMMLSDLPNCAMTFGYTNASWTLKADLTAAYVCRLLRYMDRHGLAIAVARRAPDVEPRPFLSFTSGYVQRAHDLLPRQGSRRPWQVYQNYLQDLVTIRFGRVADGVMRFGARGAMP
ncbi:MAG: NAD(P)/FAD-dependent oxidoreductase, partial [Telluria sp.]